MCDEISIERFSSSDIYCLSISRISFLASISSPEVGSSNINSFALWLIATSTRSFAFIPVEKSFICLFNGNPCFIHNSVNSLSSNLSYIFFKICIISSTVRYILNPESESATPISCLSFTFSFFVSLPNTCILPSSGLTIPSIDFIVVLFPAPLWPSSANTSPLFTSKERSFITFLPENDFVRLFTWIHCSFIKNPPKF